jgi:hypothetical protein
MRMKINGVLLLSAVLACNDASWTFEPSTDDVPLEDIVRLTRAGSGVLSADTTSLDTLKAHIPRGADTRVITFTTTAGWFEHTARAKELKVRAVLEAPTDAFLTARTVFRSDTLVTGAVVDTATVRASIGDFTALLRIPLAR